MNQTAFIVIVVLYTITIPLAIIGWQLYNWRVVWRPGYHRIIITDADNIIHSFLIRLNLTDTRFSVNIAGQSHTFGIDTECVRYIGRFRIPTYEYLAGNASPLKMTPGDKPKKGTPIKPLKIREDSIEFSPRISSIDFNNVAKNVAMAQMLASFRKGIMNPTNVMMLGFVVVGIIVIVAAAYQVNELNQIATALGVHR